MATLVSPGVNISVTDESFYAPAGAGTVPLIVIATASNKTGPDGTSTAAYTTSGAANKLYSITSQRELLQNYGNPNFKTSGGTPVHGDETNEYGLAAAYSFLGIANRAFVLRADVDLGQLEASASAPSSDPAADSIWFDSSTTVWGIKEYDNGKWVSQSANVLVTGANDVFAANSFPKDSFSTNGKFAVVQNNSSGDALQLSYIFEKIGGQWYIVGSSAWSSAKSGGDFQWGSHTEIPTTQRLGGALADGDVFFQTSAPNQGTSLAVSKWDGTQFVKQDVPFLQSSSEAYAYHSKAGSLAKGALWFDAKGNTNEYAAAGQLFEWNGGSTVTVSSSAAVGDTDISNAKVDASNVAFNIFVDESATAISVYLSSETDGNIAVDDIVGDINSALSAASSAANPDELVVSNDSGKVKFVNIKGNDISLAEGDTTNVTFRLADINVSAGRFSNFDDISSKISPSATQPVGATANAQLWYDADISTDNVDLLEHDGSAWVSLTKDFQTKATEPTVQSDGSSALVNGDVWLDSSDTESLKLYKYASAAWVLVDLTDQSSPDGVLFADFRQSASASNDADAPDPSLYPGGMLGWNYRASGGNVKQYRKNYSYEGSAVGDVWVSFSGNAADGSGLLLRKAQRKAVTRSLQAAISANDDIRNETNRFNLVAVPGYPELADEMLTLGVDRKDTVFALIDPPLRLKSDASSTKAWATNSNNAVENGENGLVSGSSQAAVYYPHGLTTNLDGTNIMVPASHMALRTFAFNDQVAFPWFAPAGFQRGVVNNATSVGYLDPAESEYVSVALNEGQRDSLYLNKVNPIASFPGRGINVFGQKTLNPVASALDRVNVSRLVIYIREQLDDAVKPFLFEPNDEVTRTNAKVVVDRFLGGLVSQRGLFDFVTVCDTSNNTPARIDRNELHIDVAIQPVKAVEFIYIPIRIQNTLGNTGS